MLPKNRQAVIAILEALKPRIIGQKMPAWKCGCGAIHADAAIAVRIEPAGDDYPGQEILWYLWTVKMSEHPEKPGHNYSCGLREFVSSEELQSLFTSHFGNTKCEEYPYRLKVDEQDRVYAQLPAAVRIHENDGQIRFSFDWGREQSAAQKADELYKTNPQRIPYGCEAFNQVVSVMVAIVPEVYRGGPNPQLPHEGNWLLDYKQALSSAIAQANHVFFQNLSSYSNHRGDVFTQADVVFMKHEAN